MQRLHRGHSAVCARALSPDELCPPLAQCGAKVVDKQPNPANPLEVAVQQHPCRPAGIKRGARHALQFGKYRLHPSGKDGHPRPSARQMQMHRRVWHGVADVRLGERRAADMV